MKFLLFIIMLGYQFHLKGQTIPNELNLELVRKKVIVFCECIHGSEQLSNAQTSLVNEILKQHQIGGIFLEYNNVYVKQSHIYKKLHSLDSTLAIHGYNPGNLYATYKYAKNDTSNKRLYPLVAAIFPQLDSNEGFYWYQIHPNNYDSIITQLHSLNHQFPSPAYRKVFNQLLMDVTYLKFRRFLGDGIRDSLMFDFISGKIDTETNEKFIILGHCGHLSKKNPYLPNNVGSYLESKYRNDLLIIGNDSKSIQMFTKNNIQYHEKKPLVSGIIPVEGIFIPSKEIKKGKRETYLIGSNYSFKKHHKLNIPKSYDWIFYLPTITIP